MDSLEIVVINNEEYFKISDVDSMPTFFMSIVSDSNHWMFIASNGGVTAGRTNAEHALFPYYTEDKIKDLSEYIGSKTIIQGIHNGDRYNWEPFSIRSHQFAVERNLYKHSMGNSIIFEEINHDVNLSFSYQWSMSDTYGIIKTSKLTNTSNQSQSVRILDGLHDVMPASIGSDLQNTFSNLVNAYKYSELHGESGLGIFALSARITDRAEPSEALFANSVWSIGLSKPTILLSTKQVDAFRNGLEVETEYENKGDRGAYLVSSSITLDMLQHSTWKCIAEVHQSQSQIIELIESIQNNPQINDQIEKDIDKGTLVLKEKIQSVDGIQITGDPLIDSRHYSNSLFNAMRGGLFLNNYFIEKKDFILYLEKSNLPLSQTLHEMLMSLSGTFIIADLYELVEKVGNQSFSRIALEYLPLTFSRRHGDPSRPWNRFSINTKNQDGSLKYDYQGNWRDIFQNWEALGHSFPLFVEGMIRKFLNASTFDGYNPYRVLKNGFEWETIEDHNPWSYIGYWGDHQIIYLLKLLELFHNTQPIRLQAFLETEEFAYAHVPYTIKAYSDIVENPKSTIEFDHTLHKRISDEINNIGSDGALLKSMNGEIHHVHFIEKILSTVLARLANYVPNGGIWMNTQRPEWNDANNALVGNGMSMVTLYYLYRFILFFKDILNAKSSKSYMVSTELHGYFTSMLGIFNRYSSLITEIDDQKRKHFMDEIGRTASLYREHIYKKSFAGNKKEISIAEILQFFEIVEQHLKHTIKKNRRPDGLYHAYNLLTIHNDSSTISYLPEMLEGQVAALSSGVISSEEVVTLLDELRRGKLYREDQNSFMLYPIKTLPGFLEKNIIQKEKVESSALLMDLMRNGNQDIIQIDIHGQYHFSGKLTNIREFQTALYALDPSYHENLKSELSNLIELYESVFEHKQFTGRSGTFFAYEGIGSIYWHMVSKLRYAVQECLINAIEHQKPADIINRLRAHYVEICKGIGVHKSPSHYGAFPTDPYSHTPFGKGAQQPGMTGQVKEDVICRMRELGVNYSNGAIYFNSTMISAHDFISTDESILFSDIHGKKRTVFIPSGSLFITICQTPILLTLGEKSEIMIYKNDDSVETYQSNSLSVSHSQSIISRDGSIKQVQVTLEKIGICQ